MANRRDAIKIGLGLGAIALLPARASTETLTVNQVLFDPDGPVLGNPKGDVTIVEYLDYQCPYCKANHPMISKIVAADGNLRLVMKDWPIFGPPSIRATQLALGSVDLGKYKLANEALMKTQSPLNDEKIEAALASVGIDVAEAAAAFSKNAAKWNGLLMRNEFQAQQFQLPGTPAYIVGTEIYPGVIQEEDLRKAIAKARA